MRRSDDKDVGWIMALCPDRGKGFSYCACEKESPVPAVEQAPASGGQRSDWRSLAYGRWPHFEVACECSRMSSRHTGNVGVVG